MPALVRHLLFCRWHLMIPDSWAHSFSISVQIGKRLVMYFGHHMLFCHHTLGGICYNPKLHHTCLPGIRPTHILSLPKNLLKNLFENPLGCVNSNLVQYLLQTDIQKRTEKIQWQIQTLHRDFSPGNPNRENQHILYSYNCVTLFTIQYTYRSQRHPKP
jgi:hypothetical protein